jgi:hypothetical protein
MMDMSTVRLQSTRAAIFGSANAIGAALPFVLLFIVPCSRVAIGG